MSTPRIVLVEDNPLDIELSLEALKRANAHEKTIVFRDGEEALDYLQRKGAHAHRHPWNPGLVLLDIGLPRLSGIEVLRRVKEFAATRVIPVIMLTNSGSHKDVQAAYDAGANGYVVKPFDLEILQPFLSKIHTVWVGLNRLPQTSY